MIEIDYCSLNQFTGNLTIDETPHQIFAGGAYNGKWFVNGTLGAASLQVSKRSSSSVLLTISAGDFALPREYNFTTIASFGGWVWQSQISAKVSVAPEPSFTLVSHSINSGTNATLVLQNGGPAAIEIVNYTVNDTAGDSVTGCFGFPIPTGCYLASFVDSSATGGINVQTVLCGACSRTGNPFTYQTGQRYTIVVTTSRLNLFTFGITA